MRYLGLATDYDATLATDGRVGETTLKALRRFRETGRKLILVTGRQLSDLANVFPEHDVFHLIVAENGATLYDPVRRHEEMLAAPADKRLVRTLIKAKVMPLDVGRCIIATREPHENDVLAAIRTLGLELHVIFNKGAVMILPSNVNKRTGFQAAVARLGLSSRDMVGIGDAENDHAFLNECGFSAAVANALDSVKEEADHILTKPASQGVVELIELVLKDDLASLDQQHVILGRDKQLRKIRIPAKEACVLIAGPSGSGKTTVTTAVLERIARQGYQFCVIDPEGDYENFPDSVRVGSPDNVPPHDEVVQFLERFDNAVVNLLGLPLADRPHYFAELMGRIQALRAKTGRPHWLVLDEAHHLLPVEWRPVATMLPTVLQGTVLVTVHPDRMSPEALKKVDLILAVGDAPDDTFERFGRSIGLASVPKAPKPGKQKLDVIAWFLRNGQKPFQMALEPGTVEHDRHQRKYAKGDLEADAFYFRGPGERLNLRAQNLSLFIQIGKGVDEETWGYHLRRHDYSNWIRHAIRDADLADKIETLESDKKLSAQKSRDAILELIDRRYTAAA